MALDSMPDYPEKEGEAVDRQRRLLPRCMMAWLCSSSKVSCMCIGVFSRLQVRWIEEEDGCVFSLVCMPFVFV